MLRFGYLGDPARKTGRQFGAGGTPIAITYIPSAEAGLAASGLETSRVAARIARRDERPVETGRKN